MFDIWWCVGFGVDGGHKIYYAKQYYGHVASRKIIKVFVCIVSCIKKNYIGLNGLCLGNLKIVCVRVYNNKLKAATSLLFKQ